MTGRRGLPVVLCACVLGAWQAAAAAGQLRAPGPGAQPASIEQVGKGRIERLERWLKAAARHTPGEGDDPLSEIAAWPNAQLKQLWIDSSVLMQIVRSAGANRFTVRAEGQRLGPVQARLRFGE